MSLEVEAPVAIGTALPTVVVPGHFLDHLPPDSLAPILAHELEHVDRRDYAVNLAQCVAEALMFHSPATWWIGRRIREAREFCCDDSAVAVAERALRRSTDARGASGRDGRASRPVLGMAGPRLITRVRRLLEGEPAVNKPYARTAAIATLGVPLAAALPQSFDAAATTAEDAMGFSPPSIPRALVGQTSAMATTRMTLCVDEKGAEYSPGAQVAIRDEPGKAARGTPVGQWVEVDSRTGDPLARNAGPTQDVVTLELVVAGLPTLMSLTGRYGTVAMVQLPGGQKWGFVPAAERCGDVRCRAARPLAEPVPSCGTRSRAPGRRSRLPTCSPRSACD